MYDEKLDENNVKLTIAELRTFEGFEKIPDSKCEEIIDGLVRLAIITYNSINSQYEFREI